jgi:hypothetical protein
LPQWRHVVDESGRIDYLDHVGRLESLEKTREWLAQTLGLPHEGGLPHLKKSGGDRYREHYTPQARDLVAEIFRKDFELFGYPLEF